jgi:polyhydroxyalkanoate synthesis regulator phasin
MDEPGRRDTKKSVRAFLEQGVLAGVGAVALTTDRIAELVDGIQATGKVTREEAEELVDALLERWREDAVGFGERASYSLGGVIRELGLVTRREHEEVELRLAQLEHRLRLVERSARAAASRPDVPGAHRVELTE